MSSNKDDTISSEMEKNGADIFCVNQIMRGSQHGNMKSLHGGNVQRFQKEVLLSREKELLSFVPFQPSKIDVEQRSNWFKRKIDQAGCRASNKFSKLRPFSSRRQDQNEAPIQTPIVDGAYTKPSFLEYSTTKIKTSNECDESIDIISYSSTRSSSPSVLTGYNGVESKQEIEKVLSSSIKGSSLSDHQPTLNEMPKTPSKLYCDDSSKIPIDDNAKDITTYNNRSSNNSCISIEPNIPALSSIEQHVAANGSIGNYIDNCSRAARKYIDSYKTRYEELSESCFFDPITFNLNDICPLNKIKKTAEEAALSLANREKKTEDSMHDRIENRKVNFADACDFEIQEFDKNLPPSTTEKGKKNVNSKPKQGVLINKEGRKVLLEENTDFTELGPIPFPDVCLKERVDSLFELLGAPEDLKKCNDLRLSMYCIHSCLSKLLGFLWSAINSALKENDFLRELLRKSEHQRLSEVAKVESTEAHLSNLKKIQTEKINSLVNTINGYEQQNILLNARSDHNILAVEKAMESMTEVIKETFKIKSFQEMKPESREKIDSLMVFLKNICDYFTTVREDIILSLNENAERERIYSKYEFFLENYPMLERENEALKATVTGYHFLQDMATDRAAMINTLKQENSVLKYKLQTKCKELDEVVMMHENELEKILAMPEGQRARALKFWEKIHYEDALTSKEEELQGLQSRIDVLEQFLKDKDTEIQNAENKNEVLEKKVTTLTEANSYFRTHQAELEKKSTTDIKLLQAEYEGRLSKIQEELTLNKSVYEAELEIYRRNYQKTIERALKLAFKAELVVSTLTESKGATSMKALRYFVNKKKSLQKFKELIKSENVFLSDKILENRSCSSDDLHNLPNENYGLTRAFEAKHFLLNGKILPVDHKPSHQMIEPKLIHTNYSSVQAPTTIQNDDKTSDDKDGKPFINRIRLRKQDWSNSNFDSKVLAAVRCTPSSSSLASSIFPVSRSSKLTVIESTSSIDCTTCSHVETDWNKLLNRGHSCDYVPNWAQNREQNL